LNSPLSSETKVTTTSIGASFSLDGVDTNATFYLQSIASFNLVTMLDDTGRMLSGQSTSSGPGSGPGGPHHQSQPQHQQPGGSSQNSQDIRECFTVVINSTASNLCSQSVITNPPLGMSLFSVANASSAGQFLSANVKTRATSWVFNASSTTVDSSGNSRTRYEISPGPNTKLGPAGLALQVGDISVFASMSGSTTPLVVYPTTFVQIQDGDNVTQWDVDVIPVGSVPTTVPSGSSVVVIRPAGSSDWFLTECDQCDWTVGTGASSSSGVMPMVVMQTNMSDPTAQFLMIAAG